MLTLFVITIAAAEITVALAIILVMFRRTGHIDLTAVPDLTDDPDEPTDDGRGRPARPETQPARGRPRPQTPDREPAAAGEGVS